MSEEEIIEKFRNVKQQNYQEVIRKLKHDNITDIAITRKEYIDKLLNIIDKLQKENEELKEQRDNAIKLRNELIEEQKITCISKNKIIGKIKELEEKDKMFKLELPEDVTIYQYAIDILKELLVEDLLEG